MKKLVFVILMMLACAGISEAGAQCSLCTKTAQQLGEGPAKGLNNGIIYMMMAPLVAMGVVGYRWWKSNR